MDKTLGELSVLLVEDSPEFARFVERTLDLDKSCDWQVDHVQRIGDAIEALREIHYDVILLDLMLPDSYGAFGPACLAPEAEIAPIVVLTSTDDARLQSAVCEQGVHDYLVKNQLERGELVARLHDAIEHGGN